MQAEDVAGPISWVVEVVVRPGRIGALRALMEELVAGARAEPGTLAYEWYVSDDGATVHVVERYAGSEATIVHNAAFAERWAARFLDAVEPTRFTVYGDPSPAARAVLDGFGATYLAPWGGFSREP